MDDGQTRLAFVICDSCLLTRDILDAAKQQILERYGLPPEHILISSTHTHSAPTSVGIYQSEPVPDYVPFLESRIVDGVARAIHNLAPARISWGVGQVPDQVFNRRWKMKPGAVLANPFGGVDQVKMNPPWPNLDFLNPQTRLIPAFRSFPSIHRRRPGVARKLLRCIMLAVFQR